MKIILHYWQYYFVIILFQLLVSCLKPVSMSHHDGNRGLCFKNHKIDLANLEWGMNKQDVTRVLDYKNYRESKNVIGYTVRNGLEFDGNQYDAVLLFSFENNKLHNTSILLDMVFDDGSGGIYYQTIKEILDKMYGQSIQNMIPGKVLTFWTTSCSKINLVMSDEYYTLRKELSIFGVKRRLSADFYDSPPDKLIRIVLEKLEGEDGKT